MPPLTALTLLTTALLRSPVAPVARDSLTIADRVMAVNAWLATRAIMFGDAVVIPWCPLAKAVGVTAPDSIVAPAFRRLLTGVPPAACNAGDWKPGDPGSDALSVEDIRITTAAEAGVRSTLLAPGTPVVVVRVLVAQPLAQMTWVENWVLGYSPGKIGGFIQLSIAGSTTS